MLSCRAMCFLSLYFFNRSLGHPIIHPCVRLSVRPSIYPSIHHPYTCSLSHSFIRPFVFAFVHVFTSLFLDNSTTARVCVCFCLFLRPPFFFGLNGFTTYLHLSAPVSTCIDHSLIEYLTGLSTS